MTAYHLYTRTKHTRWYDPFRLEEQKTQAETSTPHKESSATIITIAIPDSMRTERSA